MLGGVTTRTGKIVYKRKKHYFGVKDVVRILPNINNNFTYGDPEFGTGIDWSYVSGLARENFQYFVNREVNEKGLVANAGSIYTDYYYQNQNRMFAYWKKVRLDTLNINSYTAVYPQLAWAFPTIVNLINWIISIIKPTRYEKTKQGFWYEAESMQ